MTSILCKSKYKIPSVTFITPPSLLLKNKQFQFEYNEESLNDTLCFAPLQQQCDGYRTWIIHFFSPPLWHQINTDYRSYNLLMNAIFIIGISFFQTAISIIIQCLSCQTVWITLNSYMHCIGNKLTPACLQLLRLLLQWPHMLPKPTYLHNLMSTTLFSAVNNQFNWQVDATRKQIQELKQ